MKTSNPEALDWARKTLNINSDPDKQKTILDFLSKEHFVLNDQEEEAVNILTGQCPQRSSQHYQFYCTEQLQKELGEFRKNFFEYSISERREKLNHFKERSKDSISCKAIIHELRKGLFLDKSLFPENNSALEILIELFTSKPAYRSAILNRLWSMSLDEKRSLQIEYEALAKIDEDLYQLFPQFEKIIYPKQKVALEVAPKKSKKGSFILAFIIVYVCLKLIVNHGKNADVPDIKNTDNKKTDTPKVETKKDEFLEYMEKEGELKKQEKPDE